MVSDISQLALRVKAAMCKPHLGFHKTLFIKTGLGSWGPSLQTPALVSYNLMLTAFKSLFRIRWVIINPSYYSLTPKSFKVNIQVQTSSQAVVPARPDSRGVVPSLPVALQVGQMGHLPDCEAPGEPSSGLEQLHGYIIYPHVNSVYTVTPKGLAWVGTCLCQTIACSRLQPVG